MSQSYEKEDYLSHYEENAVDSFKEQLFDMNYEDLLIEIEQDQPHDIISEVADGACPVYTATIMQLAANNIELVTEENELVGTTPLEIISQNIYVALEQAQWEWWRANKDELEAECRAVCEAEEDFDAAMEDDDDDRAADKIIEDIVKTLHEDQFSDLGVKEEGEEIAVIVDKHLAERHTEAMEKLAQKHVKMIEKEAAHNEVHRPPGVTANMIPGNRPQDEEFERVIDMVALAIEAQLECCQYLDERDTPDILRALWEKLAEEKEDIDE